VTLIECKQKGEAIIKENDKGIKPFELPSDISPIDEI
jgi:hypothetical protein